MIPFIDLAAQQTRIKPQIDAAIARVLDHGRYIMGPEVAEFEAAFAEFIGVKHCIGMSNGTDALSASLMALGVGPGDAVITTPFTFFATVEAIMLQGATPIFADIDRETFNLSPDRISEAIEQTKQKTDLRLKGILPVDLYGLPADYKKINEIARQNDLFVLQDSAQACGAVRFGKRSPGHGNIGTVSFFPAKPLGCYGDGGAVLTDDDQLAERVRSIRVHGKGADKYDNVRLGLNARLDTIQAAILLEKLKIYPDELALRQNKANSYRQSLNPSQSANFEVPETPPMTESAWAQFVIRTRHRNAVADCLKADGIPTFVYYRTPAHQLEACKHLPLLVDLRESELASQEVLALPFHPYLSESEISEVRSAIVRSLSRQETVYKW